VLTGVFLSLGLLSNLATPPREKILFDENWRFHLGNAADMEKDFDYGGGALWAKTGWGPGPINTGFDDSGWRQLDIPHDWVVEQDFVQGGSGDHFSHGSRPVSRAYPDKCIGWYRKKFTLPKSDEGRRIKLDFDGVFRDSQVWVNGHPVARCESGYQAFGADITDQVNYGGENVVTVRADASQCEGWFYEGAGIYRHVWLSKLAPVHVPKWGTYVTTEVGKGDATVTAQIDVENESAENPNVEIVNQILDPTGKVVAERTQTAKANAWKTTTIKPAFKVANPKLWFLEAPQLYTLQTTIRQNGQEVDEYKTRFGIRTLKWDKDKGFFLNGKHVQIQGMCNHQDHAGVGSALPDRLQYFRIERLKEMGCNAYRTSHNPPTPELLDACDELGMLVMDETRNFGSGEEVLSQLTTLIRRDRNHPSVILWSIANEEIEQANPRGKRVAETMVRTAHELDPTRMATAAQNTGADQGIAEAVDIRGFNYYRICGVDAYRQKHPDKILFGSEEASTLTTRGEYVADAAKGYLTAYDIYRPGWGALAEDWMKFFGERQWLAGAFVWTGFDYRGEPTPYGWPCISSHFGILDTCGFPKDLFYYYQAWWTDKPVLHILPHWNWAGREGQNIDVWAFTNMDSVRLFLNGKDLGVQDVPKWGHVQWSVPYQPGTLEAVGYKGGKEAMRQKVETTGAPAQIQLVPDRKEVTADGRDLAIYTVSATDAQGRQVPIASNEIDFDIDGPGKIIGVGNGDPSSHEADTFVPSVVSTSVEGWKMRAIDSIPSQAPTTAELNKQGGREVKIIGDGNAMRQENTTAVYWADFDLTPDQLAAGLKTLTVGQCDDHGVVFLNGHEVGRVDEWDQSLSIDVRAWLKPGHNELVIYVKNDGNRGGLGRGVSIAGGQIWPQIHRRLFNGLAQVIVQSNKQPGTITLKASAKGLTSATSPVTSK